MKKIKIVDEPEPGIDLSNPEPAFPQDSYEMYKTKVLATLQNNFWTVLSVSVETPNHGYTYDLGHSVPLPIPSGPAQITYTITVVKP